MLQNSSGKGPEKKCMGSSSYEQLVTACDFFNVRMHACACVCLHAHVFLCNVEHILAITA